MRVRTQGRAWRRRGFTLVEVAVSIAVLVIAASGLLGALVSSTSLGRVTHESAIAQQAARRVLEELQGVPFDEIFASYNASNLDDLGLTNPAVGSDFAVAGLDPAVDDADGLCGEVQFPAFFVGPLLQLREDFVDATLGMPADLNGDGDMLDDAAADYRVLPVRIRVRWRGVSGVRTFDLETVLCER